MEHIKTQLSAVRYNTNPVVQLDSNNKTTVSTTVPSNEEIDFLLEDYSDLVNKSFTGWYAQCFRRLGREQVGRLASQARADGQHPARLFSFLLKKAT